MIGSWRWNAAFGGFGAALTFLFSVGSNPLLTTVFRSVYAFAAFALLAFPVRFVFGSLLQPASRPDSAEQPEDEPGNVLDLVTPDEEEELTRMMKERWSESTDGPAHEFQPLQPKRLVSLDHPDPGEVVKAIRRMTDE